MPWWGLHVDSTGPHYALSGGADPDTAGRPRPAAPDAARTCVEVGPQAPAPDRARPYDPERGHHHRAVRDRLPGRTIEDPSPHRAVPGGARRAVARRPPGQPVVGP